MDHMELEQEREITISSVATSVKWKDYSINLIETVSDEDIDWD